MSAALIPKEVEAEPELSPSPPPQAQYCYTTRGKDPALHNRSNGASPDVNPKEESDYRRGRKNSGNLNHPPQTSQTSSNSRGMIDRPGDDARKSEPHQPSKRHRPSASSEVEAPRSFKCQCYAAKQSWSSGEDKTLRDCMMGEGLLREAVGKLKGISNRRGRTYEACKARWNRYLRANHEQPGPRSNNSTYSPHGASPNQQGRRGNSARAWRAWRAAEDAVLLREHAYAGDSTDWESVAVKVNGLRLVPILPTPRTPGSCKARWHRIKEREGDHESKDNEDGEQYGDRSRSVPFEISETLINMADKDVPFPASTFTAGGPHNEHGELCKRPPTRPGLRSGETIFIDPESSERPVSEVGLEGTSRLPTGELQQQEPAARRNTQQTPPGVQLSEIDAEFTRQTTNEVEPAQPDLCEPPQQVSLGDVERSPPESQLSANEPLIDQTFPEFAVRRARLATPGLLLLDEFSQHLWQRGAEPENLSAIQHKIDPMLLEKAVSESNSTIKPSTSIKACRMVTRQVQRKYGRRAGYADNWDDIAKDLESGWHRSTVIAVLYKELSGHDMEPEIFETAEKDVEAAQKGPGTSDRLLLLWMCILWANPAPGQEEAESLMDEMEKLRRRESEVRAGKGKWRCVAAHYNQLASKASARSAAPNTMTTGDCAIPRETDW